MKFLTYSCLFISILAISCQNRDKHKTNHTADSIAPVNSQAGKLTLPAPDTTASKTKFCDIVGWPANKTPTAPKGFNVTRFSEGFQSPRWIYQAPNGVFL